MLPPLLGEIYAGLETDPGIRLDIGEVIEKAQRAGAEGISIETFMISHDAANLARLKERLVEGGLACVLAWGHPKGLGSGTMPEALSDLYANIDIAGNLGASVMRICAGGRSTRTLPWSAHRALLKPLLRQAAAYADDRGVTLAVENHIDMSADEMLDLLAAVDCPSLGIVRP